MIVVGLPSADVTSFKMVPAGSGPFVWEEEEEEEMLRKHLENIPPCLRGLNLPPELFLYSCR